MKKKQTIGKFTLILLTLWMTPVIVSGATNKYEADKYSYTKWHDYENYDIKDYIAETDVSNIDQYYEDESRAEVHKKEDIYDELHENCKKLASTTKDGFVIYNDILLDYKGKAKGKTLKIPSGVKGVYGFNVEDVKKIIIPSSVTDIRNSFNSSDRFSSNVSLSIVFNKRNGNPLRIGNRCFNYLEDMHALPKETTYIGYDCFCNCYLNGFKIPDGITTIKEGSFCEFEIISLTIPDSVTTLEDFSLYNDPCYGSFTTSEAGNSIKVPKSVKNIGKMCLTMEDEAGGIICEKGSAVEKYCKENGIAYKTKAKISFKKKTYYVCKGYTEFIPFYVWDGTHTVKYIPKNKSIVATENAYDKSFPMSYKYGVYIKGKKPGKTVMTAKYGGKNYNINIVVLEPTLENRVKQAVNNSLYSGMTKYDKAIALYNWLHEECGYDWETAFGSHPKRKYSAYSAEGALLDRSAVCEGYAKALNKIYDKAGLQNKIVYGELLDLGGHGWNLVKVEDGWMHVDAANSILGSDKQAKKEGLKWKASKYPKAKAKYKN